jgi:hypothetical protein
MRGHRLAMAALATVALLPACTPTEGTVRGVVTSVDGTFDDITSFTVLVEGSEVRFEVVEGGDYGFPLSHLREHMRTGQPVFVEWELVGTVQYALSLRDG